MKKNTAAGENRGNSASEDSSDAYGVALRFLERKPRSSHEIHLRLLSRGFRDEEIQETLERLSEYGFIDDRLFALKYAEEILSKGYGTVKIRRKLVEKGIDRDLIEEIVESFSDSEKVRAKEVLKTAILKREFGSDRQSRDRMLTYLVRRGFSDESAICAVDNPGVELFA